MAKQIVFRSKIKRAAGISKEAWASGIRSIAADVKAEVQALVSTAYPPASRPLTPPHKRTGRLQGGITVVVEKSTQGRAAALVVKSNVVYGPMLETGTVKMAPRPYARVVLLAGGRRGTKLKKKWTDRIARVAKYKSGSTTRKKTGNRRRR